MLTGTTGSLFPESEEKIAAPAAAEVPTGIVSAVTEGQTLEHATVVHVGVPAAGANETIEAAAPKTRRVPRAPRKRKLGKKTAAKRAKKAPKVPARCGPECRRAAACMKEAQRVTKIRMEKAGRENWSRSDEIFCERTYQRLLAERAA